LVKINKKFAAKVASAKASAQSTNKKNALALHIKTANPFDLLRDD
jgi:hypothetical protein